MNGDNKVTIIDVAKRAGVSKGTVDRVLHNRGEVSERSARKVRQAIQELNYQPNLYASLLATRRRLAIACLLPKSEAGEYWDMIHRGCLRGGEEVSSLGVSLDVFFYDQYDVESFREASSAMLASEPIGVVLPPLFKSDILALSEKLYEKNIPYAYIDGKVEDSHYLAYFGMPPYNSGVLVAALLTERCKVQEVKDILVIRVQRDKSGLSDPTVDRRAGFVDYIDAHFPECRIHNVFIDPKSPKAIYAALDGFTKEHGEIPLVAVFNSRVHLIVPFLSDHPCEGRRVIGYDDLEKNVSALRSGTVTILVGQNTEEYVAQAVSTLVDYAIRHKSPARRDNFVHMDILTALNIENY